MLISELSTRTGVAVATLKFYLREGLLMPGTPTSATRATYGDEHVARVRLVRALVDVGGLSLAAARRALAAIDEPPPSAHQLLSRAHTALPLPGGDVEETPEVRELVHRLGWRVHANSPARRALAATIAAARAGGVPLSQEALLAYGAAMADVAAVDIAATAEQPTMADAMRLAVVGTVLVDPVLAALRRLAQESCSRATLG